MSDALLQDLVGKPAADAYSTILLSHSDVAQVTVFRYKSPPPLQKRVPITAFERQIVEKALQVRAEAKVPFWNAVFTACILQERCSQALLDATFFHQGQGNRTEYNRSSLASGILHKLTTDGQDNVALGSTVLLTDGNWRHMHLLDFHFEISEANTRIAHAVCRELLPGGFLIVDSGDSYHAVSVELTTSEGRIRLLGKALLVSPIVDAVYVAHQLQQESSSIRISRGGKMKQVPVVVDAWFPRAV